jgi:hypothetical protein
MDLYLYSTVLKPQSRNVVRASASPSKRERPPAKADRRCTSSDIIGIGKNVLEEGAA